MTYFLDPSFICTKLIFPSGGQVHLGPFRFSLYTNWHVSWGWVQIWGRDSQVFLVMMSIFPNPDCFFIQVLSSLNWTLSWTLASLDFGGRQSWLQSPSLAPPAPSLWASNSARDHQCPHLWSVSSHDTEHFPGMGWFNSLSGYSLLWLCLVRVSRRGEAPLCTPVPPLHLLLCPTLVVWSFSISVSHLLSCPVSLCFYKMLGRLTWLPYLCGSRE